MRKLFYLSNFSFVAAACLLEASMWLSHQLGFRIGYSSLLMHVSNLSSPTPDWFRRWVPSLLQQALSIALFGLVVRRLWLFLRDRAANPPSSFSGVAYALSLVPAVSLWLGLIALVLTVGLRLGSGVPAGLVLLPAMLLLPFAVFVVEVLSLKPRVVRELPKFQPTVPLEG